MTLEFPSHVRLGHSLLLFSLSYTDDIDSHFSFLHFCMVINPINILLSLRWSILSRVVARSLFFLLPVN